jgi:hypothetical protein
MLRRIITIVFILAISLMVIVFAWQFYNRIHFHIHSVENNSADVIELKSNICAYMESQARDDYLGKENYHCASLLYGYDDKYAYTLMYCQGFIGNRAAFSRGTGWLIPTRFEFVKPHYQIIGFKQPGDGGVYQRDIRKLFPRALYKNFFNAFYNSNPTEIKALGREVEMKAGLL